MFGFGAQEPFGVFVFFAFDFGEFGGVGGWRFRGRRRFFGAFGCRGGEDRNGRD